MDLGSPGDALTPVDPRSAYLARSGSPGRANREASAAQGTRLGSAAAAAVQNSPEWAQAGSY